MTNLKLRLHVIGAALWVSAITSLCFAQGAATGTGGGATTAPPTDEAAVSATPVSDTPVSDTPAEAGQPASETATEATATTKESAASESAATAPPTAESAEVDGATYQVRLRDLEQRVDELKEQIRRSHTRLSLLSDTILAGASGGARAEIEFVNDLSGAWRLVEAVFVLDGAVQYKKTDDTGVLAKQRHIPIFSGSVPTGDHTLQVLLKLRGHGFGVFSYLRGIEAALKSSHSFTISDGKVLELKVTAWEKGGPTTPVEQQPDVRFGTKIRNAAEGPKSSLLNSSESSGKGAGGTVTLGGSSAAGK